MSATIKSRSHFGEQLRTALAENGVSIRGLSRRLNPANPEVARRALAKWIAGTTKPTQTSRAAVAAALGVPLETFATDEDEEEDSAVLELVHALMHRIDRKVEEHVAARLMERV